MKIAFVTHHDAHDIIPWSGICYNMAKCFEDMGMEVDYIGPLKKELNPINIARYFINQKILKKTDHPQRDLGFLRHYGRQVSRRLQYSNADVVVSPASVDLCYAETDLPMVLWTDCTFSKLIDYYPDFSNLSARTLRDGQECERRVLERCALLLYCSQWAAESAINDYGVDPAKVHVVAFGSNMPGERSPEEIERLIKARVNTLSSKVTLFCSGVSWYRKGVDVAVEVATRLNAMGINTELFLAGCIPPKGVTPPDFVKLLGFIRKAEPEGVAQLDEIYKSSHAILLPTRADCFGVVFCEASSWGLPSFATRTGGVPTAVNDGVNGYLFDPSVPAQEWANRIAALVQRPEAYAALCRSSYAEYRNRLNWDSAGKKIEQLLGDLLAQKSRGTASLTGLLA